MFSHLAKCLMLLFFWDFSTVLASSKLLMGNTVMYCSMFFVLLFNKIFEVAFFDFSTVLVSNKLLIWNRNCYVLMRVLCTAVQQLHNCIT